MDAIHKLQRAEIARINKQRARNMERRIAKMLRGRRVPQSGSGAIKGDCIIPINEHFTFYVECKLTARNIDRKLFIIPHLWFKKVRDEARAMNCLFGVLIIHWHGLHEDWLFMPQDKLHFLEQMKNVDLSHWITPKHETGELKKKFTLQNNYERTKFLAGFRTYDIPDSGTWVVVNLLDFRDVLFREESNDE